MQKALDAVHGVDLNPFAVAIARFRLIVAALQACGLTLAGAGARRSRFHLAAGDSLLHGGHQLALDFDGFDADSQISGFAYATEDLAALADILEPGRYDVVVGNPPYITVKDKALNDAYRELYPTLQGQVRADRAVHGAVLPARQAGDRRPARRAGPGRSPSNSFMKREFGKKLIEDFLRQAGPAATSIDTSGAYIPGHGTPTVILVGRRRRARRPTVKAVLGVRGEPGQPDDPAKGFVWTAIVEHIDEPDTTTDLRQRRRPRPRQSLPRTPGASRGGGAAELVRADRASS